MPAMSREAVSGVVTQKLSVPELAEVLGTGQAQAAKRLLSMQRTLRKTRNLRQRPTLDTKLVTGWNMLMALVLIEAGNLPGGHRYIKAASENMESILAVWKADNTIPHCIYPDRSTTAGLLEDWAAVALACLSMAQHTGDSAYLLQGTAIAEAMVTHFGPGHNPYRRWLDAMPGDDLICPPFMVDDMPTPSGRSLAALLFAKLATITGKRQWQIMGEEIAGELCDAMERSPLSLPAMALSIIALLGERRLVTLPPATEKNRPLLQLARTWSDPGLVCIPEHLAIYLEALPADAEARSPASATENVQVCLGSQCLAPANSTAQLAAQLAGSSPLAS